MSAKMTLHFFSSSSLAKARLITFCTKELAGANNVDKIRWLREGTGACACHDGGFPLHFGSHRD